MFKPTKLLKVVSIIIIIFAALGLLSSVATYMMLPKMEDIPGVDMEMIKGALTPLSIISGLISSICWILAGIFGVSGKSMKAAVITAGIYTVLLIMSMVQTIMNAGFTFFLIISWILPVLYWWGLYQSKE